MPKLTQQEDHRRKSGREAVVTSLAAFLLLCGLLRAEEQPVKLSVRESVDIALRNNRALAAARQETMKAQGSIVEARSEALPELSFTIAATHQGEAPEAEFEGESISFGKRDNYTMTANLSQALYKGGRIRAGLRGAALFEDYSEEGVREAESAVIVAVRKAYLDVLLQEELASVQQRTLDLALRNLDDVRLSREAGTASRFDVTRGEVEVAQAVAALTEAQNSLRVARKRFLNALSLDLNTTFELSDELSYSAAELDEAAATELALANRPGLARAKLAAEMQKEAVTAARSPSLPQVFMTGIWQGGTQSQFGLGGEGAWQEGWQVGVSASLSLFDGMRTRGRVIQERAALEQAELAELDLKQNVLLEVSEAILSIRNAEELVRSRREEVRLAEESEGLARDRFKAGKATQLDILDAQLALTAARTGLATATYSHELALLELERATGVIDRPSGAEALFKRTADGNPGNERDLAAH